jgi:hypothetical protein
MWKTGGSHYQEVYKIVSGSWGNPLLQLTQTPLTSDEWELRASGTSTTIIGIYKNGVLQGSEFSDSSTPLTSGIPSMFIYASVSKISDYECGDL